jgi:hypothetical protein
MKTFDISITQLQMYSLIVTKETQPEFKTCASLDLPLMCHLP